MLKQILFWMGLSFCLMTLSACSQNPIALSKQPVQLVYPPDSLLTDPCKAVPAGESLIDLAVAYNKNTGCVGAYKKQMQKLRDNKREKELLYNAK